MDFKDFYNSTLNYVYKYFYSRIKDKETVEDLCQEVYFAFYKKYSEVDLKEEEAVKILFGFCRIGLKNYFRQHSKIKEIEYFDDINYSEEVGEIRNSSIKLVSLKKYILTLSPKLQKIIDLRFFKQLSRKDTAELLKINPKDVHTYQKRAIKQMRKAIGQKL